MELSDSHTGDLMNEAIRLRAQGSELAESFTWLLLPGMVWRIGRGDGDKRPEVNLAFDWSVSHAHARVWFEDGRWWIEEIGSKSGTTVDGEQIKAKVPVELAIDSRIRLGKTELLIEPSCRNRLTIGDRIIEIDVAPVLNFALVQDANPFITRIAVKNRSGKASLPASLHIRLADYLSYEPVDIPVLGPNEKQPLTLNGCRYSREAIEYLVESVTAHLELRVENDTQVLPIRVCPANEWSLHPTHRKTIAAFVLPNHPHITEAVTQAKGRMRSGTASGERAVGEAEIRKVLEGLYEYFRSEWKIAYEHEMPSFDSISQKIRLPHHVLLHDQNRMGHGTCIDLVLLMASCLEAAAAQPLILLLLNKKKREHHALLGCWKANADRRSVLVNDKNLLLRHAFILDCVGFSHDGIMSTLPTPVDLKEAIRSGEDFLKENILLSAVDVTAARKEGVRPLPFAIQPNNSLKVAEILRKAEDAARRSPDGACTVLHLTWSLLTVSDSTLANAMAHLEVDVRRIIRRLETALFSPQAKAHAVEKSDHYAQVQSAARSMALRNGSHLVTEKDIVKALFDCHSEGFDQLLRSFNIDRTALKSTVLTLAGAKPPLESSYSILRNGRTEDES